MPKLNFIDTFSGAGGLSCGLELAGLNCVLGIDKEKNAIETFKLNHPNAETFCGDITKLTKKELKKLTKNQNIDLVVGGPPCQGFSTVGRGNPEDDRNRLFLEFVRIVKETKPNFVVMENVTGLLAKKNETTLKAIMSLFHKMGYVIDAQVLSSQHYGVPEKRRRTIFIGSKINKEVIYPTKTHDVVIGGTHIPAVTVGEALSNLKHGKKIHNHDLDTTKLRSKLDERRLKRIPEGKGIRYQEDEKNYFTPSLKLGLEWESLPEGRLRQTKYQRLDREKPSPTIMTHRHTYYHPTEPRYLTPREAAKIQSFPNDFVFAGSVTSQWRQIGNAVPPLLGKSIGQAILKMNKLAKKDGAKKIIRRRKNNQLKIENIRSKAFVYQDSNQQN